ncbi:F0F1 ATP synthase subunit delta [Cellulomonas sp. PhB143]|uniref:F0F1 ATP synthase subunit delta n=1 Tax=Cellulomonas sp. PhB143 TaxID=2485186 RepID=UPI000F488004|nr:F0F1 ATP synthase subunit delta [Cellulomonas sp. PhB143]ROS78469.1 ATP synthase F1 subcomplex delta subunit [Cellulomonas sp. PhB143]
MRGTSGASLDQARERFDPVLRDAGAEGTEIGEQLFTVTRALDGSATLRRSLADPSRSGEDKAQLVTGILSNGFDGRVVDLLAGLVRSRWSSEQDLADAVELLGFDAVLSAAQSRDALETVEDEIFRLTRALEGQRDARQALSDARTDPQRRTDLVDGLLAGRADAATGVLARHATRDLRGRRFVAALLQVADIAAERRNRLVASVAAAVPPSSQQLERLGALLERAYGRPVQLNVSVDPATLGGLRIQVGADVIDTTVLARLADARRRLAG